MCSGGVHDDLSASGMASRLPGVLIVPCGGRQGCSSHGDDVPTHSPRQQRTGRTPTTRPPVGSPRTLGRAPGRVSNGGQWAMPPSTSTGTRGWRCEQQRERKGGGGEPHAIPCHARQGLDKVMGGGLAHAVADQVRGACVACVTSQGGAWPRRCDPLRRRAAPWRAPMAPWRTTRPFWVSVLVATWDAGGARASGVKGARGGGNTVWGAPTRAEARLSWNMWSTVSNRSSPSIAPTAAARARSRVSGSPRLALGRDSAPGTHWRSRPRC